MPQGRCRPPCPALQSIAFQCHGPVRQAGGKGMSWEAEVAELRRREEMARRMGGPDKIKRQHDGGKLTVRERIDQLLDPGTFHEVGAIAGRAVYDAAGELDRKSTRLNSSH